MRPLYDLSSVFVEQIRTAEDEATRVYEPVIAIVTDNKDPSKLGRVKVKVPILSDADKHGDINRPLVVGALWNGKDKPPEKNSDGKNNKRVIKSRAGSKITLDDTSGALQIALEDGLGKGKITFDATNNKMIIEALSGDVCFQSPAGDTQIVAKEIELKATNSIEIHAGSTMAWGAGSKMELKASAITMSGSQANAECGNAQSPAAPSATPADVADPYGS